MFQQDSFSRLHIPLKLKKAQLYKYGMYTKRRDGCRKFN